MMQPTTLPPISSTPRNTQDIFLQMQRPEMRKHLGQPPRLTINSTIPLLLGRNTNHKVLLESLNFHPGIHQPLLPLVHILDTSRPSPITDLLEPHFGIANALAPAPVRGAARRRTRARRAYMFELELGDPSSE
jgi:hypothetical protein